MPIHYLAFILNRVLQGHTDIVEDLVWQPGSAAELASVGDDFKLLLWDTRTGSAPAAALEKAHGENDLHCVDWSSLEPHLLVTGEPLLTICLQPSCPKRPAACCTYLEPSGMTLSYYWQVTICRICEVVLPV